ncbi:MAG: NUDIX hydrolase, partial [Candidatus Micrarchaeota archaeon]|nr:NUDIX hydrolase [Candidatus Micrarchaeota archaeon]
GLFLCRKSPLGTETIELPCVLLQKGENPVATLTSEFKRQTGIDAQVHEVRFERRHNIGSRKRKLLVPVLVFKITARNASAKPSGEFSGFRWIAQPDLGKYKLCRNALWL